MVSKKGKRKLEYNNMIFYWFIRANSEGLPILHILSEDKKINLECALFDREIPNVVTYVKQVLRDYFESNSI